ncbi:pyridoxamine 5'-phosphate oxidase family protein [Methanomethylophilus alvi]|uniref:pyridoxamine 5'-phosphate oxidase family protein n=1 Tax=Methanomethylophilus alvi TaxID=1291540 RepID=UPI0037DCB1AF
MQPAMRDNQLTKEEIDALLGSENEGVLSTNGEDGYPYGAPINYVYMDGRILFHGRKVGEKVGNIRRDPRACFTVVDSQGFEICGDEANNVTTVYRSVVIRGKCRFVEDEADKTQMLRAMVKATVPEKADQLLRPEVVKAAEVYEIVPESVTGKYHRPKAGNPVVKKD